MRILNEQNVEIQPEDVDYNLGYLVDDKVFVQHHDAIEAVQEEGHYYPITFYFEDGSSYNIQGEGESDPRVHINEDKITFTYVPQEGEGNKIVEGTDVRWIIDVSAIEAQEAYDEYEDIKRYKLYTEEELKERAEAETAAEIQKTQQKQMISFMSLAAAPMALSLTDEEVNSVSMFMPEWESGKAYENGAVVRYDGGLWRAINDIAAQPVYTLDQYTAGWKRIGEPNEDGIYPYEQPLGATDAYKIGDKVTYNGKVYESVINANVWSPDAYPVGWKLVESSETTDPEEPSVDPEPTDEYPEFVQPTGAHDAYKTGDKITYNGKHYISKIDGNVWSPDAYPQGWEEVTSNAVVYTA